MALLIALAPAAAAQQTAIAGGFEHFYNLEYEAALADFRKAAERDPNDPERYNHIAQAIMFREMHRSGALESELVAGTNPFLRRDKMNVAQQTERDFHSAVARAMELSNARIERNALDVTAVYALGVAYGLRSNWNFLVKKAWIDALKDATNARKLHNRVTELDPKNMDARLVQGVHDYVVGSLPFHLRLLGFVAGFRGDRERGIQTLERVAAAGVSNSVDAQILLAAIYRRERRPREAIPLLTGLTTRFPRNYLFRLETVQMYSDAGDKESALEVLETLERLRKKKAPGYAGLRYEKIAYARGVLLFWYGDYERSLDDLEAVTASTADLDLNTSIMSWMRLGQLQDLRGDRKSAVRAYQHAIAIAPESEVAKECRRYLSSPYRRR